MSDTRVLLLRSAESNERDTIPRTHWPQMAVAHVQDAFESRSIGGGKVHGTRPRYGLFPGPVPGYIGVPRGKGPKSNQILKLTMT